jgi:hypothetical protein
LIKGLIISLFIAFSLFAQVSQEQIKEVLELQGFKDSENLDQFSQLLYKKQVESGSYRTLDLLNGIMLSACSGVSLGAHESADFGYKNDKWLPKFAQTYFEWRPVTDNIFGKVLTWQKVFRETDYYADRKSYQALKKYFNSAYIAYPVYWIIKNTFATLIRDKFKYDKWFYSFDIHFVLPEGGF